MDSTCNTDLQAAKERLLRSLRREIKDERVLKAIEQVPRELFVPPTSRQLAYEDIPLPIPEGQSISQPFIIALMTQALELKGIERVLELGTGSGYQAAILAELAQKVITVERISILAENARRLLERLGYRNVEVLIACKSLGWPEKAPYDAIIVTAGAPRLPDELLEQLAIGGRMVIPVGSRYEQELLKVVRKNDEIVTESLGGCRFVPLIGAGAWEEP